MSDSSHNISQGTSISPLTCPRRLRKRSQGTGHIIQRLRREHFSREIELFLKKNNISYEYQYSPEGLRSKQKLSYDFCIKINERIGLIEYHGVQHYEPISFGGGASDHAGNLTRDGIKERYAATNKIPFLAISHKDYSRIPTLLARFIDDMMNM